MHELEDPRNVLASAAVEQKDCIGCARTLPVAHFQRDASYKDGRRDLCEQCANSPRLSTSEHVHRLQELNYNSHAVKRQRWAHQSDYEDDAPRIGRMMHSSEFIRKLRRLIPDLYVTEGRIQGHFALYRVYGQPQPHLEGRTFEYLFYCPMGEMPEFSLYEFDARDIPVREKQRGWRTVLLRLIKAGLMTEEQADKYFGAASGPGSTVWYRQLYAYRTGKSVEEIS